MAIEPRTISATKNAPDRGRVETQAIPPAAPHATSRRSLAGEHFADLPRTEPSIEASCTIGPSRPIDPPEEIVTSEEILLISVARTRMTPLPRTTASIKSVERPTF